MLNSFGYFRLPATCEIIKSFLRIFGKSFSWNLNSLSSENKLGKFLITVNFSEQMVLLNDYLDKWYLNETIMLIKLFINLQWNDYVMR